MLDPKEIVEQMRTALGEARATIKEQSEMLSSLTCGSLGFGLIIETGHITNVKRRPTPNDFKEGVKVRLTESSKDQYNSRIHEISGKIISDLDKSDSTFNVQWVGGLGRDWISVDHLELENTEMLFEEMNTVTVAINGQLYELVQPTKLKVDVGTYCTVTMSTMQIVSTTSVMQYGSTGLVKQIIDKDFCEVTVDSADKVVFCGKFGKELEKGDQVVLDPSSIIVLKNNKKETEEFSLQTEINVSWDDIGGLEEEKKLMIELIEEPHTNPDLFEFYGRKMPKGALLYGPPGCGKTLLGKATAGSLAKIYKGKALSSGFIYIKGPEILNRFVGSSEETIRSIFERAKKHKQQYGYPATIFIDEADAILGKRGTGISSDIEKTIVPMFLTEMDGLEESAAFIILATNRPDILDPAIVRDGRIDRKIKITRPTKESARQIFLMNLQRTPVTKECTKEHLAEVAVDEIFSTKHTLYHVEFEGMQSQESFTLDKVCNGAMIANIADYAISFAMQRDISTKKRTGVTTDDVKNAVKAVFRQNQDLNHDDEIEEFAAVIGKKMLRLSKFMESQIHLN